MSKKEIYLHIGVHKTATKTIQHSLFRNKARLLAAGWLYPAAGTPDSGVAQHNLFWEINNVGFDENKLPFIPRSWDELCREIDASDAKKVILSSESLSALKPAGVDLLRNILSSYDVHVVVYLRRQDEFISSRWAQRVKYMQVVYPLEEQVRLSTRSVKVVPNYQYLLEKWSRVFGKEKIIVRVFQKGNIEGQHIFHDFLHACGVSDIARYPFSNDQNISPDIMTLEIIRALNIKLGLYKNKKYEGILHSIGNDIMKFYENKPNKGGKFMDNETAERILEYFKEANRYIAREYFGRDLLFEPFIPQPVSTFNIRDLSGWEALKLFRFVLHRLLNRAVHKLRNLAGNL